MGSAGPCQPDGATSSCHRDAIDAFTCQFSGSILNRYEKWLYFVMELFAASAGAMTEEPCVAAGQWFEPETGRRPEGDSLIRRMAGRPVVLLGEAHDNAEPHRWQLHTQSALHGRNLNMVLGFEAFPRNVQTHLDRWTRGNLDKKAFLKRTRWNQVWRFNPALYMPLSHFARLYRIPMLARNVDQVLIERVRNEGWQAVHDDTYEGGNNLAPPSEAYLDYLARAYVNHEPAWGKAADLDDPKVQVVRRRAAPLKPSHGGKAGGGAKGWRQATR